MEELHILNQCWIELGDNSIVFYYLTASIEWFDGRKLSLLATRQRSQ